MIGALISLLSLEMTARLIQRAGLVAMTLTVVGATNATPIVLTLSAPAPSTRPMHGIVSGVGGNTSANGLWVLTPNPADGTKVTLTSFDPQGNVVSSIGSGVYSSGGQVQLAFPDGSILLGRRNVAMQTAVATPRVVFVPLNSAAWELRPYGAQIASPTTPPRLTAQTAEQKYMLLNRQLVTERHRFEVHITGCATPPDPDFGDFDMTQALAHILYGVMWDKCTPDRARCLGGKWASQEDPSAQGSGLLATRGQKWVGVFEIEQPVVANPLQFIPTSTAGDITVNFVSGSSTEAIIIDLPPVTP